MTPEPNHPLRAAQSATAATIRAVDRCRAAIAGGAETPGSPSERSTPRTRRPTTSPSGWDAPVAGPKVERGLDRLLHTKGKGFQFEAHRWRGGGPRIGGCLSTTRFSARAVCTEKARRICKPGSARDFTCGRASSDARYAEQAIHGPLEPVRGRELMPPPARGVSACSATKVSCEMNPGQLWETTARQRQAPLGCCRSEISRRYQTRPTISSPRKLDGRPW